MPAVRIDRDDPNIMKYTAKEINPSQLEATIANEHKVQFLLDTGAEVSLIKFGVIRNKELIQNNKSIRLKGITDQAVNTLGNIELKIKICEGIMHQIFVIVQDDFPIRQDGIIGRDF